MYDRNSLVYVRTVTFHYIGRIENLSIDHRTRKPLWLLLKDAAWIADTGSRLETFVREGVCDEGESRTEYERYPNGVLVNASAIVDVAPFPKAPPSWERPRPVESDPRSEQDVFAVSQRVYVRAVTFHTLGEIEHVEYDANDAPLWIRIRSAAWVADTGSRMESFIEKGCSSAPRATEYETYPNGITIMADSIVDVSLWPHDVPASRPKEPPSF